jgi:iron complex transport system substrate-binding protein
MIYDMGLQDLLYGVTFECHAEALKEKPKVVRCVLEGKHYSSQEIDRIFSASKAKGKSLYYVEEALLQQIAPNVIFTQDVCDVCQIDSPCTSAAIARLNKQPQVISLTPKNLEDVFQTAVTIASVMGREEKAFHYLSDLQKRMDHVLDKLRSSRMPLKRVSLLEWMDPVYNCGHWIPFQIAQAGGVDMLSNPGGYSVVTPWEKIRRYDPEVLIIAPCGFEVDRATEELTLLTSKDGWKDLKAVRNGAVYVLDFDLFTQPSASSLVNGIELLAALFHPGLFEIPEHLLPKYQNIIKTSLHACS